MGRALSGEYDAFPMRLVDSSVVAALLMVRANTAASQASLESVARDSAPPRHFCFTPAPRSRCRSFLALDGGYTLRFVGTKRDVFNRAIACPVGFGAPAGGPS